MLTTIWNVQGSISSFVEKVELMAGTSTQQWMPEQELKKWQVTGLPDKEGKGSNNVSLQSVINKLYSQILKQSHDQKHHWKDNFICRKYTEKNSKRKHLNIHLYFNWLYLKNKMEIQYYMCIFMFIYYTYNAFFKIGEKSQ